MHRGNKNCKLRNGLGKSFCTLSILSALHVLVLLGCELPESQGESKITEMDESSLAEIADSTDIDASAMESEPGSTTEEAASAIPSASSDSIELSFLFNRSDAASAFNNSLKASSASSVEPEQYSWTLYGDGIQFLVCLETVDTADLEAEDAQPEYIYSVSDDSLTTQVYRACDNDFLTNAYDETKTGYEIHMIDFYSEDDAAGSPLVISNEGSISGTISTDFAYIGGISIIAAMETARLTDVSGNSFDLQLCRIEGAPEFCSSIGNYQVDANLDGTFGYFDEDGNETSTEPTDYWFYDQSLIPGTDESGTLTTDGLRAIAPEFEWQSITSANGIYYMQYIVFSERISTEDNLVLSVDDVQVDLLVGTTFDYTNYGIPFEGADPLVPFFPLPTLTVTATSE